MDSNKYSALLTKQECLEILQNALNCNQADLDLICFKLVPVPSDILGFLGEYYYLIIYAKQKNFLQSEKYEYFVKALPANENSHLKMINDYNVFPKETSLYTTLFKEMDKYRTSKWHAECYYVRPNILVMEDLSKQSYRHLAEGETFSLAHLKCTLESAAAMHANSIIYEERSGVNIGAKFQKILYETSITAKCGWLDAGFRALQAVAETMPKFQDEPIRKFISNEFLSFKDKVLDKVQRSNEYRNVVCHRDYWERNLLFKYDKCNLEKPTHCMPVDFQLTTYTPPAVDVLMILYLNSSRELRDNHMDELLDFYYEHFTQYLRSADVDVTLHISRDEFQKSCADIKILPLILSGVYTQLAGLQDGLMNDLKQQNAELYCHYVNVERNNLVLEHMEKDKNYRDRMLACTEEIMDHLVEKYMNSK